MREVPFFPILASYNSTVTNAKVKDTLVYTRALRTPKWKRDEPRPGSESGFDIDIDIRWSLLTNLKWTGLALQAVVVSRCEISSEIGENVPRKALTGSEMQGRGGKTPFLQNRCRSHWMILSLGWHYN